MKKIFFLIIFLFFHQMTVDALQKEQIKYVSPFPGSNYNSTSSNIILRFQNEILFGNDSNAGEIIIKGSKSGVHSGKSILKSDNRTLLFYPFISFEIDEIVTVELIDLKEKYPVGDPINYKYSFRTQKNKINQQEYLNKRIISSLPPIFKQKKFSDVFNAADRSLVKEFSLPSDFPDVTIESDDSPWGVISFSPFIFSDGNFLPNYMILMDNSGQPIFYRKPVNAVFDFKMQTNGLLSYFDAGVGKYYIMDSQLNIVDSVAMKNDYPTDLHEFVITDDNHFLMMSYDLQQIAMDTVVQGGDPNALVAGLIIQELDENKDVTFQWRSWDHFKITDATYNVDLTAGYVDYSHGNAIELDNDGNLLISSRHMDEITKISRETGEIMWRWGGKHSKNNQFTFINDTVGFSHQHDIRRLPNGNLILFDNGNLHDPPFSRAVEYSVDEQIKTASQVWEYRNNPKTFSVAMGSARRLENGNTIIGWGLNDNPPSISEVTMEGKTTFSLTLPDPLINYRAFKFTWKTTAFTSDVDTVVFGKIIPGSSSEFLVNLTNNINQPIEINDYYLKNSSFKLNEQLPILLMPGQVKAISLIFKADKEGVYNDRIYLRWRDSTQMIVQTIELKGEADTTLTSVANSDDIRYSLSQNYPNPFNPVTVIDYSIPEETSVKIKIYNTLGSEIAVLKNEIQKQGRYTINFDGRELPSGIYYYTIDTGSYISTKKMILLK